MQWTVSGYRRMSLSTLASRSRLSTTGEPAATVHRGIGWASTSDLPGRGSRLGESAARSHGVMARPPLPLGTHGEIRVEALGPKRHRARAYVRDLDGVVREVERTAANQAAARPLVEAMRDRHRVQHNSEITAELYVRELGELWFAESTGRSGWASAPPRPRSSTATASIVTSATGSACCVSAS